MNLSDADTLAKMCEEEAVCRYVPTFLYEKKYEDRKTVIEKMDEELFDTHESVMMAVCLKETG